MKIKMTQTNFCKIKIKCHAYPPTTFFMHVNR